MNTFVYSVIIFTIICIHLFTKYYLISVVFIGGLLTGVILMLEHQRKVIYKLELKQQKEKQWLFD